MRRLRLHRSALVSFTLSSLAASTWAVPACARQQRGAGAIDTADLGYRLGYLLTHCLPRDCRVVCLFVSGGLCHVAFLSRI